MTENVNLDEQTPLFWVDSSEMDFLTAVEADHLLPIAFRDRHALDAWITHNGLATDKLGRRDDEGDVILIDGLVKPWPLTKNDEGQGLYYRQVWANVDYDYYRSAMKFAIKRSEGSHKTVHLYDADHAVSRTRLAYLWPKAWVNMVLVEQGVNRAIGAMLEKDPLDVPPEADCIEINAESILKSFFHRGDEKMERYRLREYLAHARARFIEFSDRMKATIQVGTQEFVVGNLERLDGLHNSENAWSFFDQLTDSLGLDPLDRPSTPKLIF